VAAPPAPISAATEQQQHDNDNQDHFHRNSPLTPTSVRRAKLFNGAFRLLFPTRGRVRGWVDTDTRIARQVSHFQLALGSFNIRKSLMSAATRSCLAFLMASDRIDPGGNIFACARARDARAAQS
jgi:hypothetical protein